jgi:catechol 2,3-dioxygenase-like lactoylglutathione lyase family enzyme
MQLNHLDLSVPDVASASSFLVRHFGFKLLQIKGKQGMAVLAGDGGVVLVLTRGEDASYPKTFHIGFLLDDEADVGAKHAELAAAGTGGLSELLDLRSGAGFYCQTEWGILIEVGKRMPAQPA